MSYVMDVFKIKKQCNACNRVSIARVVISENEEYKKVPRVSNRPMPCHPQGTYEKHVKGNKLECVHQ